MDLSIKLNYNSLELMSKYCLLTFPLSLSIRCTQLHKHSYPTLRTLWG